MRPMRPARALAAPLFAMAWVTLWGSLGPGVPPIRAQAEVDSLGGAQADSLGAAHPDSLGGGVMIVHAVPELRYTNPGPEQGWCAFCDLTRCEDQINRVDDGVTIWYVVSAWSEEKIFSAVEFGLGDFDPSLYVFLEHGPCWERGMTMHYPDITVWPAPNSGIALAATAKDWRGSFVPVYWFAGYHYEGTGQIPLDQFPPTEHVGWLNAAQGARSFEPACLGALGVGTEGLACCPRDAEGGTQAGD